jgi:hypothetical protein
MGMTQPVGKKFARRNMSRLDLASPGMPKGCGITGVKS